MEIKLPNNAVFNTDLEFENQTSDCQEYFFEVMNSTESVDVFDSFDRPLKQTWNIDAIGFQVSRISEYQDNSDAWTLQHQYHETVRSSWHEDKNFQIIMSDAQFTEITREQSEFVYEESKKRQSYSENNYVYSYTDIILPEHRMFLESKGVIINEK